ncbi:MAG: hypothetical protein L3J77_05085, partial [Thermoplasmata archaeon]|nr:hypothetical protein [Thermoplasmata archaeon]
IDEMDEPALAELLRLVDAAFPGTPLLRVSAKQGAGFDALTALGYGRDPRLGFALGWLADRRLANGRWNLDAVHPDVEGSIAEWLEKHPKRRPTPLVLEPPGGPSKMVTLTARRVLARVAPPITFRRLG